MMTLLKGSLNLLHPLSLVWVGLLFLAFQLWRRGQRSMAWVASALWLLLSLTTCTPFCTLLLQQLEAPWRQKLPERESLPVANAIVCLGGGTSVSDMEMIGLDMQAASDRHMTAVEVFRRGKAPLLLIGGGGDPRKNPEADAVKAWVEQWRVAPGEVVSLGRCKDTHDEAEKVAALSKEKGWQTILLVTSASHMKRAQAVFQKSTGINVIAVPCAFATDGDIEEWLFLPSPGELHNFATWFHEVVGWVAYSARGWI